MVVINVKLNPQALGLIGDAIDEGLKDTVVAIAADVVKGSPVLTGNNRRSIDYWSRKGKAQIFSTSGYGGYLETGTSRMPARPYFKPAADRHLPLMPGNMKQHVDRL